jgi:uncharacterized protein (TIGR03435 family)
MGNGMYNRQRSRVLILLLTMASGSGLNCLAQDRLPVPANPQPASPSFEAASIKLSARDDMTPAQWSRPGGGEFRAKNMSLEDLTAMAYGIDSSQIKSAPGWFSSRRFYVDAKAPEGVELSREALRPCLQALLHERFHLMAHHETIQKQGFALVAADHGPKLATSKGDGPPNFRVDVGPGKLQGKNWSMDFFALMLVPKVEAPVIDRTGLQGRYDIDVEYDSDSAPDSLLPSLTAAIQKLGLRLIPQKVPFAVLVIDRVDELPTEN